MGVRSFTTTDYVSPQVLINVPRSVHVNGVGSTLLSSDCDAALTIEINACEHGSEQDHGRFHYKADPNLGKCK